MNLLEFIQKEIITTINGRVDETAKRDYKKEYEKYGKSEKAKKYRAELNKYNRDKGTYGNGDGKDASHKGGKIVGFESEKKNRGRAEKSRLKKEHHGDDFPKELLSGSLSDILDKLSKIDKEDYNDVEDILKKHFKNDEVVESLLEKCWKGYKIHPKRKTKELFGKTYPNCVKNEATFVPNSGTMSGGVLKLDNRKYQLKKDVKNVQIGNYTNIVLPKGTILYNIPGGLFADHKSLEQYETKNQRYFKKSTFRGIGITQKKDTIKDVDKNSKVLESVVNEADITIGGKEYNLKKSANKITLINKKLSADKFTFRNTKEFKDWADDQVEPIGGTQSSHFGINEEQIDEKLITFSNRAPYGQIVFMAGGAGSGKGFAIDNFIDGAGFKVRDVDEMKKQLGKLDALGKFSVDKWYKKYGKNLSTKPPKKNPKGMSPKQHIEEFVLGKGLSISDISKNLKNPNNVASLHYIVDAMGLKDKWLISMLSGKDNKETLPNLLFDITAKKVPSITDVLKPLLNAGYDSKSIHLIWVLTNYHIAVDRNKTRDRVVPDDILLQTHEGAGKTMWTILTKVLPKGLNGRIDVILNNQENTIYHIQPTTRKGKKVGVVSDFISLPIKKQGGGVIPEKSWKSQLYSWIRKNAPATLDLDQTINKSEESVSEGKNDYFKTAGEAVDFAKTSAEKKGFDIDEDDWNSQITMGGKYNRLRPGVGKTHSFQIGLLKKGKPQRKGLAISLYGMDSGKYELTHYIN